MIHSRLLCLMTNCFEMMFWPIHEEVPVLAFQIFMDEGVPLVPPVIDQIVPISHHHHYRSFDLPCHLVAQTIHITGRMKTSQIT